MIGTDNVVLSDKFARMEAKREGGSKVEDDIELKVGYTFRGGDIRINHQYTPKMELRRYR